MKKIVLSGLLVSTLVLATACSQTSSEANSEQTRATTKTTKTSQTTQSEEINELAQYYGDYDEEDLTVAYDQEQATTIKLGDDTTVDGDGASVAGQVVTISEAGTYVLSGELSNGQILVNAPKDATVRIILNGVAITNNTSSAIDIEQADKVITTLAADTENTLSDGESYQLGEGETEPDAAFYSAEDLIINGTGKLIVNGNYSNGIRSKDDLRIISGEFEVTAQNNALKGKDSVQIREGDFHLTTQEGDAIQATNAEESERGYVAIDGGTFSIASGRDGIQAETNLQIQNTEMTIQTADGADSQNLDTENESYKGLKAGGEITLASGEVTIASADDAIHSNTDVTVTGGTYQFTSGDDGMHADNTLTIQDGAVTIAQSYEGLEASEIVIEGGTTSVTASDDGVNAGGGSDTEESSGAFGQDSFGGAPGGGDQADESKLITITDGQLFVDAEGDGLDSNGNITMDGGQVVVSGPVNGGNGALDYNGTFTLTGGDLVASGTSDMAQNVSDESTQAAVGITFDSTQAAGTVIGLKDSSGTVVATYEASKDFQHAVISTANLTKGETYTIVSGGTVTGEAIAGLGLENMTLTDSQELGTFTFDEGVMNVSQAGEAVTTNQMGGPGGF